eukprot:866319-Prorocentrum_minimum.AAC.2
MAGGARAILFSISSLSLSPSHRDCAHLHVRLHDDGEDEVKDEDELHHHEHHLRACVSPRTHVRKGASSAEACACRTPAETPAEPTTALYCNTR